MFGSASVSGSFAQLLVRFCAKQDLIAPFSAERYHAQDRIPIRLFEQMLADIQSQRADPFLGLVIGSYAQVTDAGVLGYLSLSCDTLWEMLLRFMRYHRLAYDANDMQVQFEENHVEISWGTERFAPSALLDDTLLAIFMTILRQITGVQALHATHMDVIHPTHSPTTQHEVFFGCPVHFGQASTRLCFPMSMLNLKFHHADNQVILRLEQQAAALLHALPSVDTFDDELRQVLIRCLHDGEPTLDQVATLMNLSVRSLQRHLADRNQSFQSILSKTREALAQQYLQDPTLSLGDIAFLLGYSEQSAFQRAYKQWTGTTPNQSRPAFD